MTTTPLTESPTVEQLADLDDQVIEAWAEAGDDEASRRYAAGLSAAAAAVGRPAEVWASPERDEAVAARRAQLEGVRRGRRESVEPGAEGFRRWESDHTALVHVLWAMGIRGSQADQLATVILHSRWYAATLSAARTPHQGRIEAAIAHLSDEGATLASVGAILNDPELRHDDESLIWKLGELIYGPKQWLDWEAADADTTTQRATLREIVSLFRAAARR